MKLDTFLKIEAPWSLLPTTILSIFCPTSWWRLALIGRSWKLVLLMELSTACPIFCPVEASRIWTDKLVRLTWICIKNPLPVQWGWRIFHNYSSTRCYSHLLLRCQRPRFLVEMLHRRKVRKQKVSWKIQHESYVRSFLRLASSTPLGKVR